MKDPKKIEQVSREVLLGQVQFGQDGLVPAVAQDWASGDVLMLAWVDQKALAKTLETGYAHYHSRSRGRLWKKGEESGHLQRIRAVRYDCDADTLLFHVEQEGVACHTGRWSCFYREAAGASEAGGVPAGPRVLDAVFTTIASRKGADPRESYTAGLLSGGLAVIAGKIREESAELIEAAESKKPIEITKEFSDLLYHSLVLLASRDVELSSVYAELARRFGTSGHEEKRNRKK